MSLTMYDSTNPLAIPTTAEMIAIYIDGLYRAVWAANIGRFPNTPKRRIACVTTTTRSDTADFERYDLTPADAPVWYRNMVALGETNLWAYANRSNRVAVEDAMWAAGIRELSMWIATLDGTQQVTPYRYPVAAVQYTDTGSVDLSAVFQTFGPGGGTIGDEMTTEEHDLLMSLVNVPGALGNLYKALGIPFDGSNPGTVLEALKADVEALKAAVPPTTPAPEPKTVTGTWKGLVSGDFTGTLTP